MKKRIGKYLEAQLQSTPESDTFTWHIYATHSPGVLIGKVYWVSDPWQQYAFEPMHTAVYDISCLEDIAKFLKDGAEP